MAKSILQAELDAESTAERSQTTDQSKLTLVLMPFLGGSWEEWAEVISALSPRLRCIGLDLPGFGDAAEVSGYAVEEMANYVAARLRVLKLERFILVGHSMAGKVSMVIARLINDNDLEISGLAGLVLVASSPPSPEPISAEKRDEMTASLGRPGAEYRKRAEKYIRENTAEMLAPHIFERAVRDVLRMNCGAWNAWLDSGSKEDWSERVGRLSLPALVIAGAEDKALGLETQAKLVMPHLPNAELKTVDGAAHLIPMERSQELAQLLADFAGRVLTDSQRQER